MRFIGLILFSIICLSANSQTNFNLELVANVNYSEAGNDIWGYVHEDSTEYAIVGTEDFTRIYNLSDPANPREIIAIRGSNSTWRDMKSWEDHVYVTTDVGEDGLLVIDMSEVSTDSIRFQYLTPQVPTAVGDQTLGNCHNLYIDENGYCYLAGCSRDMNKAIIFDLNVDKWTPPIVGVHGGGGGEYAHDLMVQDNIMYSSEINTGDLVIFDVTDKANIVELGRVSTSFNFTHNAWVSTDGNYVYTTDERGNAFVDAYDISNLPEITRVDMFQPAETANRGVIPHNTHFIDDFLVTSWYSDGVVITDVSRPGNMVKMGAYDTYLGQDGGFNGCWGVYPWLPSGLVIANDIQSGFYVFKPEYVRACHLEGVVSDAVTGAPINDAQVEIIERNDAQNTNVLGEFKTGYAEPGMVTVRFSHINYNPLELQASLSNGELTILNAELTQPPKVAITGMILDAATGQPIANGKVKFSANPRTFAAVSDANGTFLLEIFEESYEVVVGAWGYQHLATFDFMPGTSEAIFRLDRGYQDDFVLDLGWKVSSDASTGLWERGVPIGTTFQGTLININADVSGDLGEEAYVTGNGGGGGGFDDIDDGRTDLRSPEMFLEDYAEPVIEFRTYFYNAGGTDEPNDSLLVSLSDGTNSSLLTSYIGDSDNTDRWTETLRFRVSDTGLDLTQPITITYSAMDSEPGHLVEAAVDVFKVVEAATIGTEELTDYEFINIFPNPTSDMLNIVTELDKIESILMYDSTGKLVIKKYSTNSIDISHLESGVYVLVFEMVDGRDYSTKVIKR